MDSSKRSASDVFEQDLQEADEDAAGNGDTPKAERPDKKHTLDSDEEDSDSDDEKYNILNENDIEGEEDGIAKMDGEIKLTPFNMTEEQEEGHFDADGHFQWDRTKHEVRDNWLDNLEWVRPKEPAQQDAESSSSSGDEAEAPQTKKPKIDANASAGSGKKRFDAFDTYRAILELMRPGETVKRALQRLGGGRAKRVSSAERWRQKRAGQTESDGGDSALVTRLTELSNAVLSGMGNMDVYDETYEHIRDKYAAKTKLPVGTTDAAELDIYADDFSAREQKVLNATPIDAAVPDDAQLMKPPAAGVRFAVPGEPKRSTPPHVDEVLWEFKWSRDDESVHGGYSSAQMQQWVQDGYFKDGVYVRKCGQEHEGTFNSSNRIDFELYL